jgi:hypothetical protein
MVEYEIINILADNAESIFLPMDEKSTEEHKSATLRNSGKMVYQIFTTTINKK